MLAIRVFALFDKVVCTVQVEPTHTNGWPQVPQAPFSLGYLQEDHGGQWENPSDLLPMIAQALEASDRHIGSIHGGMIDALS